MQEESKQEKEIREISENKNPYAQECPNRHLYSEGFRAGYSYAQNSTKNELVKADVIKSFCPVCGDELMQQVNSTNLNCVRCGETVKQTVL